MSAEGCWWGVGLSIGKTCVRAGGDAPPVAGESAEASGEDVARRAGFVVRIAERDLAEDRVAPKSITRGGDHGSVARRQEQVRVGGPSTEEPSASASFSRAAPGARVDGQVLDPVRQGSILTGIGDAAHACTTAWAVGPSRVVVGNDSTPAPTMRAIDASRQRSTRCGPWTRLFS